MVAAGSGARFGAPKQRALLLGRPLYLHALGDLAAHPAVGPLVLVVPAGEEAVYRRDLTALGLDDRVRLVAGGPTRTASVRAGVEALADLSPAPDAVLVQDAARPAAPAALVDALLDALAAGAAGAVPVLEASDTLRWRSAPGGPAREAVGRVGTPQAFRLDALREAHARAAAAGESATDDALLVEAQGGRIAVVEADGRIEKVTRPEDLAAAAWRLGGAAAPGPTRTGLGLDHHRLALGRPLWLCGIRLQEAEGLVGHSDGDVALHALANAILGASGERDIGHHVPDDEPQTAGIASREIVALARQRARSRGLVPAHAQIVLTAPRPRISPYVGAMAASVAAMLDLAEHDVAVHATSGEGLVVDAIEAHAVVTLAQAPPLP